MVKRFVRPRRKRTMKKRQMVLYKRPNVISKIHNFKRTYQQVHPITLKAIPAPTHYTIAWTLGSLPNSSEFTTLFDQYRICGVKTKIIFNANSANFGSATNTYYIPNMLMVKDYDDATALTTMAQYQEYGNFKVFRIDYPKTTYTRPKIAIATYGNSAFTSYSAPVGNPWVDCGSANVEYYGMKWTLDTTASVTADIDLGEIQLYHTVYFQCKNTR